jgi:exodeoxyribonuclease VII large subunit
MIDRDSSLQNFFNGNSAIYTVSKLNRQVKISLERVYGDILLEAEVCEATVARSGHIYFRLTDPKGSAQMDAVIWRTAAARYAKLIKKGAYIRCTGKVTLYEAGGRYQFVAHRIEDAGAGARALELEKLKQKLLALGIFDNQRKRPLPSLPSRVGVVTSRDGAALQDIIKVMSRRYPARLLLSHARVQGENAAQELVTAINRIVSDGNVDVIIIGRGGGSADDLDAFNDERVVMAIANSPVPVICAVGHEVDVSLSDMAADRRAATPSEAAELAVPEIEQLLLFFEQKKKQMANLAVAYVKSRYQMQSHLLNGLFAKDPRNRLRDDIRVLSQYSQQLAMWPASALGEANQRLDDLSSRMIKWAEQILPEYKNRLEKLNEGLKRWPIVAIPAAGAELGRLGAALNALSPLASLGRGYSIVKDNAGSIINSTDKVSEGDSVNIIMSKGSMQADVTKIFS